MSAHAISSIEFEVFKNLFVSVAEEMGVTLCRTGFSPNIKERLDYSCAVYDRHGRTIAQGDHMPVHLGAMPLSVQAAIEHGPLEPGEYTFYCSVDSHRDQGMEGTIVVN